ncbi:MAG: hypothetical protein WCP10_14560 [Desulfuromonadales bacterium]
MKTICAWCKLEMTSGSSELSPEGLVSHGICGDCTAAIFGAKKIPLTDYLDSLDAPVIVVNGDVRLVSANEHARKILQQELPEIEDRLGGDVFECVYAKLPEGCGNTIHCIACTIRNTVTDTFSTGNPHIRVPAYLKQGIPGHNQDIELLISTQKVAEVVLLRIDKR